MSIPSLQALSSEALALLRRHNLLRQAVTAEIIAETVQYIALSKEQTEHLWQNYLQQNKLDHPEQLRKHLKQLSLLEEDLHWHLELSLRIQKHSNEHFQHKAEARFLARKEQLDTVVYSLIRLKDFSLAREIYLRIAGGEENFGDLAAAHSQGLEAKTKGIVGPVPLRQAHPALSERLRTSLPGEALEPFQIEGWWVVARLERYEPAQFDAKTAQSMAMELFQESIQEKVVCKLAEL
ncbi:MULTISPECIES: peptidylprolyl isomerase [Prochlorococcus]|uniref:peptidylprolyl isomerase n=1 Tax=Prochlorococcus TaxID=1218 RepID=UPI0007B3DAEE|nr:MULTISPECIES: peptidylprolyl isomerase [Prochlorococcus]KZR66166.1 Chaperone SurA [Prochlorococcus marinus str. MIT 1312]KZR82998.1 Chaperone SurA [Prochlorococcus marinus str. MIT 1327]NMP05474.1 peptidylprolyl isomerase [Prochlorococcus sp. P1361]NMP13052.1 peptidylprolyl isomerase [Prochlorococcus sp.P1363]